MQLEIDGNRELTAEFRHNCILVYPTTYFNPKKQCE